MFVIGRQGSEADPNTHLEVGESEGQGDVFEDSLVRSAGKVAISEALFTLLGQVDSEAAGMTCCGN